MPVLQAGSVNTTALIVPDLYVQVVPPSVSLLNGVPTNLLAIAGTASWGPVGAPVPFSSMADYFQNFGPVMARKYDLGTAANAAILQGANNFMGVRVTDGTDVAATATIALASAPLATAMAAAINNGVSGVRGPSQLVVATVSTTSLVLTALYTGSRGNLLQSVTGAGSAATTSKITIALPGQIPEVFDNIGISAASVITSTFASGTDGATTITSAVLIGVDTVPRKGMYAFRNTQASVGVLADADDVSLWSTQASFGLSEGIYMIAVGPVSQSISAYATATAAVDTYALCPMLGDWIYFKDVVNNQTRLISPQGFKAGKLVALGPNQSTLNKPLYGIIGTQKSYTSTVYSNAELQLISTARGEVITNPSPGGQYFSCRFGRNCSSDQVIHGDNYTRMTNYIAYTLNAGMGKYIGRLQTVDERREAWAKIDTFLANMEGQGLIGDVNGGASHQVVLDATNNPNSRVALGYQQADVKVVYLSIIEVFLVNVEGGQSVTINRLSTTSV